MVGVRERHRADLLDHRRRVAVRHARELVAPLGGVEIGLVRDLVEVEVEDVDPVALRRRAEPDVAAEPSGSRQCRIELRDRDVRRADEVDLRASRPRWRQAQRNRAEPARDDEERVEDRVHAARDEAPQERGVVDPVHRHEQLVQRELAGSAHHPPPRSPGSRSTRACARTGGTATGARALGPRTAARARRASPGRDRRSPSALRTGRGSSSRGSRARSRRPGRPGRPGGASRRRRSRR